MLSFYYTAKKPRQRYGMQEDELQKINNFILYVAKGYPQALEAIYENIGGRMLSVAFSVLKDRYLAEDVVQDSFLKIAKNARRFEPGTNGIAWICKIVRNTALDYLKREKKITKVNVEDCFDLGGGRCRIGAIGKCDYFRKRIEKVVARSTYRRLLSLLS